MTQTLWIRQQSHGRQLPKLTKKSTEKKDDVLNVQNKAIWLEIARTDLVDRRGHAPQKQQTRPK
jgi:hypothetical protein